MSGVSDCSVYDTIESAGCSLKGKTKCFLLKPLKNLTVDSISMVSKLYVAGERIVFPMNRQLDEKLMQFKDEIIESNEYHYSSSSSLDEADTPSATPQRSSPPPTPQKAPVKKTRIVRPEEVKGKVPAIPLKARSSRSSPTVMNGGNILPRLPTSTLKKKLVFTK